MPPAGRASRKDCAAAILFAAENATRAALNAIQLLGGNGCVLLLVMHMPRSEPAAHALGVRRACGALCSTTRQRVKNGSEQVALWLRLSPQLHKRVPHGPLPAGCQAVRDWSWHLG